MIETAAAITERADIFVIIGTSLAVYPAAGLVNYTDPTIPKFIVDKQIPVNGRLSDFTVIEAPASVGVQILAEKLLRMNADQAVK